MSWTLNNGYLAARKEEGFTKEKINKVFIVNKIANIRDIFSRCLCTSTKSEEVMTDVCTCVKKAV